MLGWRKGFPRVLQVLVELFVIGSPSRQLVKPIDFQECNGSLPEDDSVARLGRPAMSTAHVPTSTEDSFWTRRSQGRCKNLRLRHLSVPFLFLIEHQPNTSAFAPGIEIRRKGAGTELRLVVVGAVAADVAGVGTCGGMDGYVDWSGAP